MPNDVTGAPPAEVGALSRGGTHRRHLAATLLDLGARGHLRVARRRAATPGEAPPWWQVDVVPRLARSGGGALRPHEVRLLDVLAGDGDLGVVLHDRAVRSLLAAVRRDAAQRGWLRTHRRRPVWLPRRTTRGRVALAEVHRHRAELRPALQALGHHGGPTDVEALPTAVALGVAVPWEALQRRRVPVPAWFTPGHGFGERGWLGLQSLVLAVSTTPDGGWELPSRVLEALGSLDVR